jgi:hypothetical protein
VGTEIFNLLLESHNSKPSTDPISVPNKLAFLFVTTLTFASSTVPSLEPSLISTVQSSLSIDNLYYDYDSNIDSTDDTLLPSSVPILEPSLYPKSH